MLVCSSGWLGTASRQRLWCGREMPAAQSLPPCRSRTRQVDGCLNRQFPVRQASLPEFQGCSSGRAKRACMRSSLGFEDLSVMGMQSNSTLGLSAFSCGPCYLKAWLMGVQIWKHRAYCCMSWWRAHWWSRIRRFDAVSPRGGLAVLPGYSVFCGFVSSKIWTQLLLYFCVVDVRVWVLLKVELCMVSSPRKRFLLAKASVSRTHSLGLAARLTEHIRCLYRPGLKRCKQTPVSTSEAQVMERSFLSIGCLSTISRTFAAEALVISMEAAIGSARGVAEERRTRRKGENAKVRAPRRRPWSWRRRKRRPWESIWGCSATEEALSNWSRGKPVQFPGARGLDIPFFSSLHSSDTGRTCFSRSSLSV